MTGSRPAKCRNKVTFASWDEANLVLVECKIQAALHGSQRRREQRAYWCGEHQGFHLTSQQQPSTGASA